MARTRVTAKVSIRVRAKISIWVRVKVSISLWDIPLIRFKVNVPIRVTVKSVG